MNIGKVGKILLPVGALALSWLSGMLTDKAKEAQTEELIAKKVAEALKNQTKGS